jgi:hypothetical protein
VEGGREASRAGPRGEPCIPGGISRQQTAAAAARADGTRPEVASHGRLVPCESNTRATSEQALGKSALVRLAPRAAPATLCVRGAVAAGMWALDAGGRGALERLGLQWSGAVSVDRARGRVGKGRQCKRFSMPAQRGQGSATDVSSVRCKGTAEARPAPGLLTGGPLARTPGSDVLCVLCAGSLARSGASPACPPLPPLLPPLFPPCFPPRLARAGACRGRCGWQVWWLIAQFLPWWMTGSGPARHAERESKEGHVR